MVQRPSQLCKLPKIHCAAGEEVGGWCCFICVPARFPMTNVEVGMAANRRRQHTLANRQFVICTSCGSTGANVQRAASGGEARERRGARAAATGGTGTAVKGWLCGRHRADDRVTLPCD